MANIIRIKRRAAGGAAGAPASLATSEIAYNEQDDILYIGFGDNGSGVATSIRAFAGFGAAVGLTGNQTIGGTKTFSSDVLVPDEAYGAGWDGSLEVPTKNAVYDQIEAVSAAGVSDGDKGDVTVSGSGSTWTIDNNAVSDAKLRDSAALSVIGRSANSSGDPADIAAASDGDVLRRSGTSIGFGTIPEGSVTGLTAALAAKAPLASPTFTGTPAAPTPSSGTHTTQIATTAYVITEIAARLAAADAMTYKGAINASSNPNYPAANAGDTYRISVAGKIGGASGPNVQAGDMIMCHVDSSAGGTHASVGADWDIIQVNIDGALTTTDIGVAVQAYNANLTTWAGKTAPSGTVVGTSDAQTLTNKTADLGSNTISGTKAQFDTAVTDGNFLYTDSTIDGGTF